MIISVASGKGSAGKTTIAAAFVSLAENVELVDWCVDAAECIACNKGTRRGTRETKKPKER